MDCEMRIMAVSFILSDYISKALDNALYDKLDDGTYCQNRFKMTAKSAEKWRKKAAC